MPLRRIAPALAALWPATTLSSVPLPEEVDLAFTLTPLAAEPDLAYAVAPVEGAGSVTGTITFTGKAPAPAALEITEDVDYCAKWNVKSEELLVSAGKGLGNAIVWVDGLAAGNPVAATRPSISNAKCRYEPHVQAVGAGSTLLVKNEDPILHNTHIRLPKSDVANYALPRQGQVLKKQLTRTGLMKVGCDAGHTWMTAYIAVFDHPYFAVTDASGRFTIGGLPPGTHRLVAWHEKLGQKKVDVTVQSGSDAQVALQFP